MAASGTKATREMEPETSQQPNLRISKDGDYDMPKEYEHLDELTASPPDQNPSENPIARVLTLEEKRRYQSHPDQAEARRWSPARSTSHTSRISPRNLHNRRRTLDENADYDVPDNYAHLNELEAPSPVENTNEEAIYLHKSLEEANKEEQDYERNRPRDSASHRDHGQEQKDEEKVHDVKRFATQLYTISYLIFFAIFGTLARLGLQALTFYPGAPVVFTILWPNFGGSMFMGFLSEDRMLFKEEWGTPTYHQQIQKAKQQELDEENGSARSIDLQAAKKAHAATKKTIPLYIGLATGFCGSFTSFSTFIRDAFLALSNTLPTPLDHPADQIVDASSSSTISRNGGYSLMALLGVILVNIAVSVGGLYVGAHLAIALEPFTPSLPFRFCRKFWDRLAVFLAWGCWLGAVFLAIFPPDRNSPGPELWRGRAVFAIVFAPLGCLGRFYASIYLNGRIASFPLGTFFVNIAGTAILGMCYDLQHVPLGGVIGCQVLQGIEDGFCGCLTTVSTWVSELASLRRSHSYRYGGASVIVALCLLIVIMGSMQWTVGFSALQCLH